MPTKVNREAFLRCLESVSPGLSPRELLEQSSCLAFQSGDVFSFNEEIACRCPSLLDAKFTGAVPAKPLTEQLGKWSEDEIEVDFVDGELLLTGKGGRRKSGIRMEAEVTLPIGMVEKLKDWHALPESFAEAVSIVQTCAGKDEARFASTCVHLHPKWLEACDGYQVCRWRLKTGVSQSTLVRQTSIKHVVTLGMTHFSETAGWLHFKNPNSLVLSCRQYTEHDFPTMDDFFTLKDGVAISLPKGLEEAADKANVFSATNVDGNQVQVTLKAGLLRLRGQGINGWYEERRKVAYNGQPLEFLISPQLLGEIARQHSECEVTKDRLKVQGEKWVYLACLAVPEKKGTTKDTDDIEEATETNKARKADPKRK